MNKTKENLIYFVGIALIAILYTYIRLPMLNIEDSLRGWNSDYAIFVMMGEDIKTFSDFPFYYWGGNYLGPLNNASMAITQWVMEIFGFGQEVPLLSGKVFTISPLAASINCLWMLFMAIFFYGLAFKRIYSVWESLLACLLLSIGDAMLIRFSLRPLAPEVALLLGGLITWRGLILIQEPTSRNQFIFGFLFGFSWWMNQITVFALVPIFYYFVSQSSQYHYLRGEIKLVDRIRLRTEALGWKKLSKVWRFFLGFIYGLGIINFLMGVVIAIMGGIDERVWGVKLKIHNGFSPMKTSVLIFLGTQFLMWFFLSSNTKEKIKKAFFPIKAFLYGLALGYGPVILGRIFKLYDKGYKPQFKFVPLEHLFSYWNKLIFDFFPKLMIYKNTRIEVLFFILFLISLLFILKKNSTTILTYITAQARKPPIESALWGTVLFNFIYVVICERSRDQYAFRYAILSLPILSIYLVTLHRRIQPKVIGVTLTILLSLTFGYAKYQQGHNKLNVMKNETNLQDKLQILIDSDCEIFFSNYWNTYVYEYLLQHEKKFAVVRGQDRTEKRTKDLKALNLKKCDLNEHTFEITEL